MSKKKSSWLFKRERSTTEKNPTTQDCTSLMFAVNAAANAADASQLSKTNFSRKVRRSWNKRSICCGSSKSYEWLSLLPRLWSRQSKKLLSNGSISISWIRLQHHHHQMNQMNKTRSYKKKKNLENKFNCITTLWLGGKRSWQVIWLLSFWNRKQENSVLFLSQRQTRWTGSSLILSH